MDRFIACAFIRLTLIKNYLKSNMDRFIDCLSLFAKISNGYLKSNMDRFIVKFVFSVLTLVLIFKIQYG